MELVSENKIFDGRQLQYKHRSEVLDCEMVCSIFLPPQAEHEKVPVLYWLSGLTCTDQNFVTKAGAQRAAAEQGIALICPDTSPRGLGVPDDDNSGWDFGLGAGFYVNATQAPWSEHYQMYDYVVEELPNIMGNNFPVDLSRASIFGHSMGGHGALTIALKNTNKFESVSAFSPIVSPINCLWGEKALSLYLGDNKEHWRQYDTCALVEGANNHLPILIDQGEDDDFLEQQLKTPLLESSCERAGYPMQIRYQEGYDHSYFFIASFIAEHIVFHKQYLV